ncbi:MAG: hypothetical protein ACRDG4_10090, partial [Chloroflexota bacterium]
LGARASLLALARRRQERPASQAEPRSAPAGFLVGCFYEGEPGTHAVGVSRSQALSLLGGLR